MLILYLSFVLKELTDKARTLKEKIRDLGEQELQLDEERSEIVQNKTKLELDIKDFEDAKEGYRSTKVRKFIYAACSHI